MDVQQKPIGLRLDNRMQVTRSSGQGLAAGAAEGAVIRKLAGFLVGSVGEFTSILRNLPSIYPKLISRENLLAPR